MSVPGYHLVASYDHESNQSFVYYVVDKTYHVQYLKGPLKQSEKAAGTTFYKAALDIVIKDQDTDRDGEHLTVQSGEHRFAVLDYASTAEHSETRIYYIATDGVLSECCWTDGVRNSWYHGSLHSKGFKPGKGSLVTALVDNEWVKVYFQKANDLWVAYTKRESTDWSERQVAAF